jgi:hypothetical protein
MLRLTMALTPPMTVDACWSAICKENGRTAEAMRKDWYVPGSLISAGPPETNGETHKAFDRSNHYRKLAAGLDLAGHLLPAFRSARAGIAALITIRFVMPGLGPGIHVFKR